MTDLLDAPDRTHPGRGSLLPALLLGAISFACLAAWPSEVIALLPAFAEAPMRVSIAVLASATTGLRLAAAVLSPPVLLIVHALDSLSYSRPVILLLGWGALVLGEALPGFRPGRTHPL